MTTYLLERADIYIYALDTSQLRNNLLHDQSKIIKNLSILYLRMIKERCGELKRWLTKSAQELTGLIIRIE